jgi:imidazole glycerol-phosphate synthase subunit HisF
MNSKKNRVIAVILIKNGNVVQSKLFKQHRVVGDPYVILDRLTSWNADEVIYINIRPQNKILLRQDKETKYSNSFEQIIEKAAKKTFYPFTVGGGIQNFETAKKYFYLGADKICINSAVYSNLSLINEVAKVFGSQAIVANMDLKRDENLNYSIYTNNGKVKINKTIEEYIDIIESEGAGELLINSIDNDGLATGYDMKLLELVKKKTKLPIIFMGGAGEWSHMLDVLDKGIDAVAASNIFHFSENSYYEAVNYLNNNGAKVREPILFKGDKYV